MTFADAAEAWLTYGTLKRNPKRSTTKDYRRALDTYRLFAADGVSTTSYGYAKPQIHEQDVTVRGCTVPLRRIAVRGFGHDHPTNDCESAPKQIVGRYAKRMRIEQRLAEQIRSFHLDSPGR